MIDKTQTSRRFKMSPSAVAGMVLVVGLGLMATACKEPAKTAGETGSDAVATGKTAAENSVSGLPDFAPAYPGAIIKTQVTGSTLGEAQGSMIVLETRDSIETVIGFYDARAKSLGVKPELVVNEKDSAIRLFAERDAPSTKGGMISVSPADDGKSTSIVITTGQSAISAVQKVPLPVPLQ